MARRQKGYPLMTLMDSLGAFAFSSKRGYPFCWELVSPRSCYGAAARARARLAACSEAGRPALPMAHKPSDRLGCRSWNVMVLGFPPSTAARPVRMKS